MSTGQTQALPCCMHGSAPYDAVLQQRLHSRGAIDEYRLAEACHVDVQVVDHAAAPNPESWAVGPLVQSCLPQLALPTYQDALADADRLPAQAGVTIDLCQQSPAFLWAGMQHHARDAFLHRAACCCARPAEALALAFSHATEAVLAGWGSRFEAPCAESALRMAPPGLLSSRHVQAHLLASICDHQSASDTQN